ncbi:MAG: hypothetical protein ACR2MO_14650 [Acidimicrobiales bacterium]
MTLALAVLAGWLAARLLWTLLRPTLDQSALLRPNWRDHDVPTAAGVVVALAVVVVEAGRALAGAAGIGSAGLHPDRAAVAVVVVGMALVGLLDDLAGGDDARGFRGHLTELARGRLTTGAVKLFGGLAVATVAVAVAAPQDAGLGRLVADASLVALAANLGNLLDRRPGRAAKAGLGAFLVLAAVTAGSTLLVGVAVVAGAAAALLLDDLREHLMLGDTGANVLGGAVGLGVVLACAPATRTLVLVAVVVLNGVSEVVSFGRVIDAVPPLRALDRWGRRY